MEFISEGHHVIQDYDFDRYEDMTYECLGNYFYRRDICQHMCVTLHFGLLVFNVLT